MLICRLCGKDLDSAANLLGDRVDVCRLHELVHQAEDTRALIQAAKEVLRRHKSTASGSVRMADAMEELEATVIKMSVYDGNIFL